MTCLQVIKYLALIELYVLLLLLYYNNFQQKLWRLKLTTPNSSETGYCYRHFQLYWPSFIFTVNLLSLRETERNSTYLTHVAKANDCLYQK